MGSKPTNVLELIGCLGWGGDTTAVLNAIDGFDNSEIHVDFITHARAVKTNAAFVERLRDEGHKVAVLDGDVRMLKLGYAGAFRRAVEGLGVRYDVLHAHTSLQSGIPLGVAKKMGIPRRICHSHTGMIQRKTSTLQRALFEKPLRGMCVRNATDLVACSKVAGDFLYGSRPYKTLYNGIDTDRISSVPLNAVNALRVELGCAEDTVLIGHIASFRDMKNQTFTLRLAEAFKGDPGYCFVLVGAGNNFEAISREVVERGLTNVRILGRRDDVAVIMNALDCMILPSLLGEGFPMTVLEAVAAGTPCVISDNITAELLMLGDSFVKQLPLHEDSWCSDLRTFTRKGSNAPAAGCASLAENGLDLNSFRSHWASLYR